MEEVKNYILKNATVITMNDGYVMHHTDVMVSGGKITRMAAHIEPYGLPVIDCTNQYLLPGLIDSHIHMDSNEITEMTLANGVTTVRNMWGFPITQQWCREIDQGKRFGSKVYSTGPLTDGVTYWDGSLIVTTPEEAEKAVVDVLEEGYDYVKTYPSIPREAFLHLMEVANNYGIKVVGHGNFNVSFKELADSGYYTLEHSSMLPSNEEEIIMLAESGMWHCPTFLVGSTIEWYAHQDGDLKTTPNYDMMAPYWRQDWEKVTAWRKSLHRYDNLDIEEELNRSRIFAQHSDHILLGTDVPNPGVTGGFSVYEEMELMEKLLGWDPYRILRSATVLGAEMLGIREQKGRLLTGMDADILILDKDPMQDIRNARSFTHVIKEGRIYTKAQCDAVLKDISTRTEEEIHPLM